MGCLGGHAAGYELVRTSPQDAPTHGYLGYAPPFLAACLALITLALALRVLGRLRGQPAAWPFALLPPLAFVAQELIERLVAGLPAHAVLEPAVYAGLAAQLPIAFLGLLAARALLRMADDVTRAFSRQPALAFRSRSVLISAAVVRVGATPLAFDHLGRAPPR